VLEQATIKVADPTGLRCPGVPSVVVSDAVVVHLAFAFQAE